MYFRKSGPHYFNTSNNLNYKKIGDFSHRHYTWKKKRKLQITIGWDWWWGRGNRTGDEEGIHIHLHMARQPAYAGTLLVQFGGTWRMPNCYCPWKWNPNGSDNIQMQITYYINDTMDKLAFQSPQRPHLMRTVDLRHLMMIRCWHVLCPKWLSHFVPICLENEVADCWYGRR